LFLAVGVASDMMLQFISHSGFRARSHSKSLLGVWHHRTEGSAATLWVAVVKYSSAFGLSSSLFTDLLIRVFLYFCLVIRFYGLEYAVQK
jgi:hypothetical protein